MKKIKNYFNKAGWMLLPPSFMAYDKQQHGLAAAWATIITFYPTIGVFNQTPMTAAIVSVILVNLFGWGVEFYQKWFQPHRHFDPADALVMGLVNLLMILPMTARAIQLGF